MAGILQNVFTKGIYSLKDPENVSKIKTLVNHSALYFGLIIYTGVGAKVGREIKRQKSLKKPFSKIFQLLEHPTEMDRLEMNQAMLVNKRVLLINTLTNNTVRDKEDYRQVMNQS